MLGLRYVACEDCDTVAAVPMAASNTATAACGRCGSMALTDLTGRFRGPTYFADVD
ncbi:hypothetical protein [Haloplanus salilacus]|uniref:hypothetical protein n=1 Tax=Haloplanus salilacus TaxID=2949994 RepID=UPI0030CB24D9